MPYFPHIPGGLVRLPTGGTTSRLGSFSRPINQGPTYGQFAPLDTFTGVPRALQAGDREGAWSAGMRTNLQVSIDATEVLDGLAQLKVLTEQLPVKLLDRYANKWRRSIQRYTPIGPPRVTSGVSGDQLTKAIVTSFGAQFPPSDTFAQEHRQATATFLQQKFVPQTRRQRGWALSRFKKSGYWHVDRVEGKEMPWLQLELMARQSLVESVFIYVHGRQSLGELVAGSTAPYAYYVENGFLHTFQPTLKIDDAEFAVSVDELGAYEWVAQMQAYGEQTTSISGKTRGGKKRAVSQEQALRAIIPRIAFMRRTTPRWQPGVHMFERGTGEFLAFLGAEMQLRALFEIEGVWYRPFTRGGFLYMQPRIGGKFSG